MNSSASTCFLESINIPQVVRTINQIDESALGKLGSFGEHDFFLHEGDGNEMMVRSRNLFEGRYGMEMMKKMTKKRTLYLWRGVKEVEYDQIG